MTVTKTVFIGAVAIVATAFHGCGNKEEENQNSDETQSTETDEQEQVLKARQRDTENVVKINLKQAEEIEALKAKNQALEEAANSGQAGGDCCTSGACCAGGACQGGNAGDEDAEFEAQEEKLQAAIKRFLVKKGKATMEDLNEDELEQLADHLQFVEGEDFKAHVKGRKDQGQQHALKLAEDFEHIADIEGEEEAQNVFQAIMKRVALKKNVPVEKLTPDHLTEEDYAEIAHKVDEHFLDLDLEDQVGKASLHTEVAENIKKAGKKAKKYKDIMKEQNFDDPDDEQLEALAENLDQDSDDLEAHLAVAIKKAPDQGQQELLEKVKEFLRKQDLEKSQQQESLADFMEYVKEKHSGKAFDQLTKEEIRELVAEIGEHEKMLELERAVDDASGEAPEPFTEAAKDLKHAAKTHPKKSTLKKKVEEHNQAMEAAAAAKAKKATKKASTKSKSGKTMGPGDA